jgi:tRNA(fMet)-specific endonuclease VapC
MRRTLDTNICSTILRRHPASMIERFATLDPTPLWLSAIVAAELRFGAVKLASPRFSAAVEAWLAGAALWTRDKRLRAVATELALAHVESQH